MKTSIGLAALRDLEELMKIERECFAGEAYSKAQIVMLLMNRNSLGLVARVNGEVAGFVIGVIENAGLTKAGHVYTIDVAIKHRRKGIGIRLLKALENKFLKRGAETSYLEVRADNSAAIRFYRKEGYFEIESLQDYYKDGVNGLRLMKKLGPN